MFVLRSDICIEMSLIVDVYVIDDHAGHNEYLSGLTYELDQQITLAKSRSHGKQYKHCVNQL